MNNFAKIEDVEKLWRSLTEDEKERAKNLLPIVEDSLRMEADKVGKNLDRMIEEKSYLENVAKSVVVDVIARTLMTSTDAEPMTQRSESALGYSIACSVSVREAAANTISSTLWAASEEAAAEEATDDAALEAAPPQAVRAAAAPAIPAATRKLRREMSNRRRRF